MDPFYHHENKNTLNKLPNDTIPKGPVKGKMHIIVEIIGIVIPAHTRHCFNANEQFKMISTIIKSGYED